MCQRILRWDWSVAATTGAARGNNGKEEWDPDSGATFHMPPTRAGMTAYKKAPAGTTVKVADETILPIDVFRTVEVDWTWTSRVYDQASEDRCRRVCARTFAESTIHP